MRARARAGEEYRAREADAWPLLRERRREVTSAREFSVSASGQTSRPSALMSDAIDHSNQALARVPAYGTALAKEGRDAARMTGA